MHLRLENRKILKEGKENRTGFRCVGSLGDFYVILLPGWPMQLDRNEFNVIVDALG